MGMIGEIKKRAHRMVLLFAVGLASCAFAGTSCVDVGGLWNWRNVEVQVQCSGVDYKGSLRSRRVLLLVVATDH